MWAPFYMTVIHVYIPNTGAEKEAVNSQVQSEIERKHKQNALLVAGELDAKVIYSIEVNIISLHGLETRRTQKNHISVTANLMISSSNNQNAVYMHGNHHKERT